MMMMMMMKRAISRRETQRLRRCFSPLAQTEQSSSLSESDVFIPKMPPFDYSPPPYTGPTADQILRKRNEFLSPSMFYFYNKPVSSLLILPCYFFFFIFSPCSINRIDLIFFSLKLQKKILAL